MLKNLWSKLKYKHTSFKDLKIKHVKINITLIRNELYFKKKNKKSQINKMDGIHIT